MELATSSPREIIVEEGNWMVVAAQIPGVDWRNSSRVAAGFRPRDKLRLDVTGATKTGEAILFIEELRAAKVAAHVETVASGRLGKSRWDYADHWVGDDADILLHAKHAAGVHSARNLLILPAIDIRSGGQVEGWDVFVKRGTGDG